MRRRHVRALVACVTVAVLGGLAVWLVGPPAQPAAPPPGDVEEVLRNPLRPRDHSRRVDRLALIDTADAFRAGDAEDVMVTDGKAPRVVLAQTGKVVFPRRGTWTGPETVADFPFTELVASWNAATPKDTGVFFQVRTRGAKSREWSPWLFVGRWGRTVHARSGEHLPSDQISRFAHGAVRMDMPLVLLSQPADAYQVRATLQSFDLDPAVNPSVRRLAVAYSGVVPDPVERARLLGPGGSGQGWARDLPVPHRSQHDAPPALSESVCLPACVTMVLAYWEVDRPLFENALAIYDPDSGMFGNGARAVARAGELGLDAWMQRVRDWGQVKALIGQGQPVIAAVRLEAGEHLIVVHGFTQDGDIIVNDPLDRGKSGTTRKADELGRAWFGCGGFACVIRRPAAE
jgi:Peptidase_C39 like family